MEGWKELIRNCFLNRGYTAGQSVFFPVRPVGHPCPKLKRPGHAGCGPRDRRGRAGATSPLHSNRIRLSFPPHRMYARNETAAAGAAAWFPGRSIRFFRSPSPSPV